MRYLKWGLGLLALVVGCTPTPGGTAQSTQQPTTSRTLAEALATAAPFSSKLSIVGAKSLFVTSGPASAGYRALAGTDDAALYRLDADNAVSRVSVEDASGNSTIDGLKPLYVTSTRDFIYLSLMNQNEGCYVVRKSDGKIAKVADVPLFPPQWAIHPVETDRDGNLYLIAYSGVNGISRAQLVKIVPAAKAADGSETLVKTPLTNLGFEQPFNEVVVNQDGDAMVTVRPVSGNTNVSTRRIYRANGSVVNAGTHNGSWPGVVNWVGTDGAFYTFHGGPNGDAIQRITVAADGSVSTAAVPGAEELHVAPTLSAKLSDRDVFADPSSWDAPNKLYVFQGMSCRVLTLANLSRINDIQASESHVFVSGQDAMGNSVLEKVDPVTGQETGLFSGGNYQVFGFSVNASESVTVSALRMSDNTYVVGVLGNGTLETISSELPKVQTILPLQ